MDQPNRLVKQMRLAAGLSQRELAARSGTSQPQLVRYERGQAMPAWGTLERIAAACGQRLRVSAETVPEREDVELAEALLELTPQQRLQALSRFAHLRELTRPTP